MSTPVAPEDLSRRQQLVQTYKMTKKSDPRIGLVLLLAFAVAGAAGFALFYFLPGPGLIFAIPGAILFGILAALIIFGRRAQKAAYAQMEGQAGSAAAALKMLRKGWRTDPVVAFNKQQDIVHRVVGPPGIVLVGEGNSHRVKALLATERRKHERVVSETPVHEVVCGNGDGEVPLTKLVRHITKLGRAVKPAEMTDILNRLKALDANRSNIPIPKGPMPTSMKGSRQNMRGR
jgi:hypothetical protein